MTKRKSARGKASQTQRWLKLGADTAPERLGQRVKEKKGERFYCSRYFVERHVGTSRLCRVVEV